MASEKPNFFAQVDRIKDLCVALKAIDLKSHAVFSVKSDGLQVTTEKSSALQTSLFLKDDFFGKFETATEVVLFSVNLSLLLECLSIFDVADQKGGATTVDIVLQNGSLDFSLETADYEIQGGVGISAADAIADLEFDPDNVVGKVILKAHVLRNFLSEIDATADYVGIAFSHSPQCVRLIATGFFLCSEVQLSNSPEVAEEFFCTSGDHQHKYSTGMLKHCLTTLQNASKLSLRIDSHGVLCLHALMQFDENKVAFTELLLLPQIEDQSGKPK